MSEIDPLHAISVPQPVFGEAIVRAYLADNFALDGELQSLVSERDQNFRVITPSQERYVFKIANRSEPHIATDFQIKALLHLEAKGCDVPTPRVLRTCDGEDSATIGEADNAHLCRVVSFLPGELLSNVDTTPQLAHHFGGCAARLDKALADFEHPGQAQSLLWDLQRASELRPLLSYIEDEALRDAARMSLDDFDARVLPALRGLRRQVVHSDLHGDNVLVSGDQIAGVIDFGDMLNAPLIMEVAVASAYLRPGEDQQDSLRLVGPFVAAYNAELPLLDAEIGLLYDLVRARLVATVAILYWRSATRGADDDYSSQNLSGERDAESFLLRLAALGRDDFTRQLKKHIENR